MFGEDPDWNTSPMEDFVVHLFAGSDITGEISPEFGGGGSQLPTHRHHEDEDRKGTAQVGRSRQPEHRLKVSAVTVLEKTSVRLGGFRGDSRLLGRFGRAVGFGAVALFGRATVIGRGLRLDPRVRRVKPGSLEDHATSVEDLLYLAATLRMATQRLVGELLEDLEVLAAAIASVFVSRHRSNSSGEVDRKL